MRANKRCKVILGLAISLLHLQQGMAALLVTSNSDSPENAALNSYISTVVIENDWNALRAKLVGNPKLRDEYHGLLEGNKEAEETFVTSKLNSSEKPAALHGVQFEASWIPTTLWDLFLIYFDVTREDVKQLMPRRGYINYGIAENSDHPIYLKAFPLVIEYLRKCYPHKKNLKDLTLVDFQSVAKSLLQELSERGPESSPERIPAALPGLLMDYEKMKANRPNHINKILELECKAHEQNQDVIWRSTDGARWDGKIKILDHPKYGASKSYYQTNGIFTVSDTKNMSFSYSPLAGGIGDSSACTYCYIKWDEDRKGSDFSYAVFLDRKWQVEYGYRLFILPPTRSTAGAYNSGEFFHPQLKRVTDDPNATLHSFPKGEPNITHYSNYKAGPNLAELAQSPCLAEEEGPLAVDWRLLYKITQAAIAAEFLELLNTQGHIFNLKDESVSHTDPRLAEIIRANQEAEAFAKGLVK